MNTTFRQYPSGSIAVYRNGSIFGHIHPSQTGGAVMIRWNGEREVREGFKSFEAAKAALRAGREVLV